MRWKKNKLIKMILKNLNLIFKKKLINQKTINMNNSFKKKAYRVLKKLNSKQIKKR